MLVGVPWARSQDPSFIDGDTEAQLTCQWRRAFQLGSHGRAWSSRPVPCMLMTAKERCVPRTLPRVLPEFTLNFLENPMRSVLSKPHFAEE